MKTYGSPYLRSHSSSSLETSGARIRHARLSVDMTQEEFAKRISQVSSCKITKAAVSKWETNNTGAPQPENAFAIQAITGFSAYWLVTGRGEERVPQPSERDNRAPENLEASLDHGLLQRALTIAVTVTGADAAARTASVTTGLYDVLLKSPELNDAVLASIATVLASQIK